MSRKCQIIPGKDCCNCEGPACRDCGNNVHSCGDEECDAVATVLLNRMRRVIEAPKQAAITAAIAETPDFGRGTE
jgi:hypothetical protein